MRRLLRSTPLAMSLVASTLAAGPVAAQRANSPIQLRVQDQVSSSSYITAVARLANDAYVMVVNVGPDGYARVIFPASPTDAARLRGDSSYAFPEFHPGFPSTIRPASIASTMEYRRYPRPALAPVSAEGPGYVFAIASSNPIDFAAVEKAGMWARYHVAEERMLRDPALLMARYAEVVRGKGGADGLSSAFARYAGWEPTTRPPAPAVNAAKAGAASSSINRQLPVKKQAAPPTAPAIGAP